MRVASGLDPFGAWLKYSESIAARRTEKLDTYLDVLYVLLEDVLRLADISQKCCERVQHAVSLLPKLSETEVAAAAIKTCEEIDQLESDADRVLRSAMSKLFRAETDVREVIKLKAIYELLETITDKCEDVANQIEGIVLENS